MFCPCCVDEQIPVFEGGQPVATVTRQRLSICELVGKMNRFTVDFGQLRDPALRKLLFGAAMLFDLTYWEQNK